MIPTVVGFWGKPTSQIREYKGWSSPPRGEYRHRNSKPPYFPRLSATVRIMAVLSQFARPKSNKEREMILCQIKQIQPAAGIS